MEMEQTPIQQLHEAYSYFFRKINLYRDYNNKCEQLSRMENAKPSYLMGCGVAVAIVVVASIPVGFIFGALFNSIDAAFTGVQVCIVAAIIAMILINKRKANKNQNAILEVKYQAGRLEKEIEKYYREYPGQCPVHIAYSHPETIAQLCSYLETGRADSLKEALNLMEEELHRNRMEQQQQRIEYRTAQAARAATASAFISAANFVRKK